MSIEYRFHEGRIEMRSGIVPGWFESAWNWNPFTEAEITKLEKLNHPVAPALRAKQAVEATYAGDPNVDS